MQREAQPPTGSAEHSSAATVGDGGPAFPVMDGNEVGVCLRHPGMTLRDYFAGQAMSAMRSDDDYLERIARFAKGMTICQAVARLSYEQADAMLRAGATGSSNV